MNNKKIVIFICILCFLSGIVTSIIVFVNQSSPLQVLKQFVEHWGKEDYNIMYDLTTNRYRSEVSFKEFYQEFHEGGGYITKIEARSNFFNNLRTLFRGNVKIKFSLIMDREKLSQDIGFDVKDKTINTESASEAVLIKSESSWEIDKIYSIKDFARITAAKTFLNEIMKKERMYFSDNGVYTNDFEDLHRYFNISMSLEAISMDIEYGSLSIKFKNAREEPSLTAKAKDRYHTRVSLSSAGWEMHGL